jgi:hypothetical protein
MAWIKLEKIAAFLPLAAFFAILNRLLISP